MSKNLNKGVGCIAAAKGTPVTVFCNKWITPEKIKHKLPNVEFIEFNGIK